ncbi:hypothetical protein KDK77_04415, partial [bacterium]|nr:hypothetical protein [bacterium]
METNSKISVEKSVKLYEKAQDSFKRNNFDYAINILLSVIKCAPQFVKARHLLHLIARKRLEKHKLIILQRIIGTIIGLPHLLAGLFYYAKQEYVKAAFSFEKTILHDPANPLTLSLLGECAWKLDMPDTAIDVFEMVKDLSPKHTKTLYVLGNLYKDEAHDLEKAKECFSAILCYDKHNQKARKGISDVAALQTIEDGKYDDLSSSFLTKVKSSEFNEITEKKLRAVKSEEDLQILIKDTEQKYREEPSNVKVLIELAGYYREGKDYSKAISCYQEAKRLAPEDYTITRFIMDTETGKID